MIGLTGRSIDQLFDLTGKVAIVTGAGAGIGVQMAAALAEAGADIVLCSRKRDRCEQAAEQLEYTGVRRLALGCDVARDESVERMVDATMSKFGRIDILVNNAGTTWGAPAAEYPIESWEKVISVNLTGTFLCSQHVGRHMLEQGSGKIVNIASVAAIRGANPEIRQAVGYSASKGGVVALTQDLASQWGSRGVNVNSIAPGWFPTSMAERVLEDNGGRIIEGIPLGRLGGVDDLKGTIVFLASQASDYVTGQTLVVDGGKSVW